MILLLRRPFFRGRNLPTPQIIVSRTVGTPISILYLYVCIYEYNSNSCSEESFFPYSFFLRCIYLYIILIPKSHFLIAENSTLPAAPHLFCKFFFIVVLIILATTRLSIIHLFYGTTEQICRRVS